MQINNTYGIAQQSLKIMSKPIEEHQQAIPKSDYATLSLEGVNKSKGTWEGDKMHPSERMKKNHADYKNSVDTKDYSLISKEDAMRISETIAYGNDDCLCYGKEVNGVLVGFFYPDGSNSMNSTYASEYKEKWASLREERISTFEMMKKNGEDPREILKMVEKLNPRYADQP